MNLKDAILKEHSKKQCERIVKWIGTDKKRFAELFKLFLGNEYTITQRAAYALSVSVEKHPELITPYYKKLLDNLAVPGKHEAVARNTMRLLQFVELPRRYHGRIMHISFRFIEDPSTPAAVKAFSLSVLERLAKIYPDIVNEIRAIVNDRWDQETQAFHSRGRRFRNE